MNKDYTVSLSRVLATFFIVLCHLANHFGYVAIAQFFNVGVYVFFLISGYLYGEKKIENSGGFIFRRYVRLEVPALIWLSITVISAFLHKTELPAVHECVFLLLNLQGLKFVFSSIQDLFIGPWFFTYIMICYVVMLLYLRVEKVHPNIENVLSKNGGLIPFFTFAILGLIHINTGGLMCFFLGMSLKRKHNFAAFGLRQLLHYIVYFIIAISIRLVFKKWTDNSVLYNEIIVPFTHIIIAACLFSVVKWIFAVFPQPMVRITSSKIVQHLDRTSIYIYICHEMLFSGVVLSVFEWPFPIYVLLVIYFCLVVAFATVLYIIGQSITNRVEKIRDWLIGPKTN